MKRDTLSDCLRLSATLMLFAACGAALQSENTARGEDPAEQTETEVAETEDQTSAEEESDNPESGATLEAIGTVLGKLMGIHTYGFDSEEGDVSSLIGEPAPEIELNDTAEQPWKLSDEEGRIVVIDFWATWCGPCVAAMPKLQTLSEDFADNPVTVIGVNQGEDLEDVKEFIEEKGLSYPQLLDPDSEAGDAFEVSGIPQIVLVDANGIVQSVHVGFSPDLKETLTEEITALLNGDQLYDEEEIAEARAKREEKTREAREQVAELHPERLETLSRTEVGEDLYLDGVQPSPWCNLPGTGERAAVLDAGGDRAALIVPSTNTAKTIDLPLDDMTYLQLVSPAVVDDELHLAALTYVYDQSVYEYTHATVFLFNQNGEEVWSVQIPMLGEYQDNAMAIGDFDGDGNSEIATLVEYEDIDFGSGAPDRFRVLTLLDHDGQMACRRWIEGHAGTGLLTTAGDSREQLLVADEGGLLRLRYDSASAPEAQE